MKRFRSLIVLIVLFQLLNAQQTNHLVIFADSGQETISKNLYGHFAEHLGRCIYDGIWVGEDSPIPNTRGIRNDIVDALKEIQVPVIRWPGGCFADTYHWKDGIGPKEGRKPIVNTTWGWGLEDNSFGTHEFLDFCELIGAEPYLAVNMGSGTVEEAREWVEYVNGHKGPMADLRQKNGREQPWNVKYWGVGNESWGCGGNMSPDYYAHQFKQYSTFIPAKYKILSGGTADDFNWTEVTMKTTQKYKPLIQGYSYHYYTICHNWTKKGSATDFNQDEWFSTMKNTWPLDENLTKHEAIMDKYDPENKVAIIADEWGNWFDVEPGTNPGYLYQQNTLRDAVTAGLYLNIFNNHCERVKMANIAQTVNVLQAMILTKEEQMVKTPTFYVFKMFKVHQDAKLLPFELKSNDYVSGTDSIQALSVSASLDSLGKLHISLVNLDPKNTQTVECEIKGDKLKSISAEIITATDMQALNDFGAEEKVNIQPFEDVVLKKNVVLVTVPSKSLVTIELKD